VLSGGQFRRTRILSAVSTLRLFVYSGLLALLITGTAFAGRYQRTKDGTTLRSKKGPKPEVSFNSPLRIRAAT